MTHGLNTRLYPWAWGGKKGRESQCDSKVHQHTNHAKSFGGDPVFYDAKSPLLSVKEDALNDIICG